MRVHWWNYVVSNGGNVIRDCEFYVYLAGTNDPAYLYSSESGGSSFRSFPEGDGGNPNTIIKSNDLGFVELWVGDSSEIDGYDQSQKFKIAWYKEGIASGEIDYVQFFIGGSEVDETDSNVSKNKLLSNFLAKKWNDHSDESIITGDTPHNIEQVDEYSNDTTKNKLVSNFLISHSAFRDFDDISTGSWSASGGLYYYDVTNYGPSDYVSITTWNVDTERVYIPENIQRLDSATFRIWSSNNWNTKVVIIG